MPAIRQPTTRVMLYARLASALFWTVAAAWLLVLSLWISLHIFIVPRIDQFRPWLQEQATRALGVQVELGPLSATSKGLVPEFDVDNIRLLRPDGAPMLSLKHLTLRLTPTSALQGEFSQITMQRLAVDVMRDAEGKLHLGGMPLGPGQNQRLHDWVFSQWEWVLREGEVHFTDALGTVSHFSQIEAVMRNGIRKHQFRMDVTPQIELGQRFSLRGVFSQPLLSIHAGLFDTWSGQIHLQASQVNLAAWQNLWAPGQTVTVQGQGWIRGWLGVRAGRLQSWTQDFDLNHVQLNPSSSLAGALPDWRHAQGRFEWVNGPTQHASLTHARLAPENEPAWPLGQADIEWQTQDAAMANGQLKLDALDLAQLSRWHDRLPRAWSSWLKTANPRGLAQNIKVKWTGSLDQFQVQQWGVRLQDVSWQPAELRKDQTLADWPGVSALSADLSGNGISVQGTLKQDQGHWQWPGLWDTPVQKVSHLQADLQASFAANEWHLKINRAQLLADSARADIDLDWVNTPQDPLGRLQLNAKVPDIPVTQITGWLPQSLPAEVRQYVQEALPQGRVQSVTARVSGRLADFPFTQKGTGEFNISGLLSEVKFITVPKSLQSVQEPGDWPVLQDLSGELVFDRASVKLSRVKARVAQAPGMAWSTLEAQIKQLDKAVVTVRADGKGPLNDVLRFWKTSPLNGSTHHAMDQAKAQGVVDLRMSLSIPIEKPDATQVNGAATFAGNDISFDKDAPTLNRVRGGMRFTANGFELHNVQALLWGGEVRLEGAAKADAGALQPLIWFKAQGQANARGLQEAPELASWSTALKNLQGNTNYSAQIQWRRGQLETQINSNLVGMTVLSPAGLGKTASQSMPVRFENSLIEASSSNGKNLQDQASLRWGALEARLIRDLSGSKPRVLRGLIRLGSQTSNVMPDNGVVARINAEELELDSWSDWLQGAIAAQGTTAKSDSAMVMPQKIELQAQSVGMSGRHLHQVLLEARNQGDTWSGHIQSQEMDGDISYQMGKGTDSGHLRARLTRLSIPAQAKGDADVLLDQNAPDYPTLDLEVKDLDLRGKKLGSLVLQAQNQMTSKSREWHISRLVLSNDDGTFSAQGDWQKPSASARSQTHFDFKLTLKNAGNLLNRLGTPDAVRNGSGSIEGEARWLGTPISPDTSSMSGQFRVNVERGQFLKTEPGAARLLGVLNLQALPRRLLLDFRDVFSEGFAFDVFRGDVVIDHGLAKSDNLQMKGVSALVLMEGQADIGHETQHVKVLVIPDINTAGASLLYSTINPVVGLTTFIAQYVLRRPLTESNTQQFEIEGTWDEPKVTQVPFKPEIKP
jgi:uncharacterized protein (TIGR02099 family)